MKKCWTCWWRTFSVVAALTTVTLTSVPILAQGPGGPPPADAAGSGPPITSAVSASEPLYSIPPDLYDPAFAKFVDLKLLGDAYLNNDTELMVDIALQLQEGESVLLRPHHGLKAAELLDIALRLAAEQRQMATLDRLSAIADKHGDKALAEKLVISKQLAAQPRDAAPPVPVPSEQLTSDEAIILDDQLRRLERARAVGDVQELTKLKNELLEQKTSADEFENYLEKQVADAISNLPDEGAEPDEVVKLLGDLSGASRGVSSFMLEQTTNGGVAENALSFKLDIENRKIYISKLGAAEGNGFNEWVPQASWDGIAGRQGTTWVNYDWAPTMMVNQDGSIKTDNNGKPMYTGRWFQVHKPNPGYVQMALWNSQTNAFDYSWVGMHDVYGLTFENGPPNASAIIAAATQFQPGARIVAAGGGNFTYNQIVAAGGGNITFASIVAAGGGNIWPREKGIPADIYAKAGANPNGGATIENIVAAGGGNITIRNIVAAGGGNLRPMVTGNIVVPRATTREMWAAVSQASLIQDGGAYLIGQDGASLLGKGGAGFAKRLGGSYTIQSVSQSPFFKNAEKSKR